jgi:hypothetical protein
MRVDDDRRFESRAANPRVLRDPSSDPLSRATFSRKGRRVAMNLLLA